MECPFLKGILRRYHIPYTEELAKKSECPQSEWVEQFGDCNYKIKDCFVKKHNWRATDENMG